GDSEGSLREAKAALALTPNNVEAHKNAGLAYQAMRKFDACSLELREALRVKPDYETVHFDFAILLYNKGDLEGSIAEYKRDFEGAASGFRKAAFLETCDPGPHFRLGALRENQKIYVATLVVYRLTLQLDSVSDEVHSLAGRVSIAIKDFPRALIGL